MTENGVELLGFQHPGGFLPYTGGLLTIYGHNGAGKSLLLESIESSLTGRCVGRTKPSSFEHYSQINSAAVVRTNFSALDRYGARDVDENVGERLQASLQESDSVVHGLKLAPGLQAAWNSLYHEFLEASHAVIAPAGLTEARWLAFVATAPGGLAETNWPAALDAHVLAAEGNDPASDGDDLDDAYVAWNDDTD